jgi:putative thioredoxin
MSTTSEHIVDVTMANARETLIDASFERPVLIDFWADWCGPCKSLMPILEKLAVEYAGQFLLARVDCDREQAIAAQFNVRSLPTVMLMKDGQPVDGFSGALPESEVRTLLEKYLPKPWDLLLEQARAQAGAGDLGAALALLGRAWEESRKRADIGIELASVLVQLNRLDEAQEQLGAIRLADRDQAHQQVQAQLDLRRQAAKTPEIQQLEVALAQQPDSLELRYQLALANNAGQQHREALELLVEILRRDRDFNDGAARKTLLDIIATLGNSDPLAKEYQRRLFSLLY